MKKPILILCLAALLAPALRASADTPEIIFKVRASYNASTDGCAFRGDRITAKVSGKLDEHFSYSIFHNFNKPITRNDLFNATDWAWLQYSPDSHWKFQGGKVVMDYGCFEYDDAPIDLYITGEYWNYVVGFLFGASAGYDWGRDYVKFQITQSPFHTTGTSRFAYNLSWYGNHGGWKSIWTVNFFQQRESDCALHIALGDRFTWGPMTLSLDLMNRCDLASPGLLGSTSVAAEIKLRATSKFNFFLKINDDRNSSYEDDLMVAYGLALTRIGGGLEFKPLDSVRLHAYYCKQFGTAELDTFNVGVTWALKILNAK